MNKIPYWKDYKFIWAAEPFKSSLGPWDKKIYELFRDRWEQSHLPQNKAKFTDDYGNVYFTADEQKIADLLGIGRCTVSRAVTKLEDLMVLRVYRKQESGTKRVNYYYMYPIFHDLRIAAKASSKKLQDKMGYQNESPAKASSKMIPVSKSYNSKNEYINTSSSERKEDEQLNKKIDSGLIDIDPWS
jgi:hypothetical protein